MNIRNWFSILLVVSFLSLKCILAMVPSICLSVFVLVGYQISDIFETSFPVIFSYTNLVYAKYSEKRNKSKIIINFNVVYYQISFIGLRFGFLEWERSSKNSNLVTLLLDKKSKRWMLSNLESEWIVVACGQIYNARKHKRLKLTRLACIPNPPCMDHKPAELELQCTHF